MQVVGPPGLVKTIELIKARCKDDEAKAVKMIGIVLKDWYVGCSVTGEPIAVSDLKYWNVERNEVYKDAETGLKRHMEIQDLINS